MAWDDQNWEYFQIQKLRGTNFADEWPSIPEYLQYTIERFPNNSAFTSFADGQHFHVSYRELGTLVEALALSIQAMGIQAGDKIVISGKNSPAWGLCYLAALCIGCVVVPLDSRQEAKFHQHLIEFTDAKLIFMDADLLLKLGEIEHSSTVYRKYILNGELNTNDKHWGNIWQLLEPFKEQVNGNLRGLAQVRAEDLAALLTTSGTTGNEKVAMLSHQNFTSNVIQCVYPGYQEILSTDRIYLFLPMHHSYPMTGVFLESICHGSEIIFPQGMAVQQIIQDLKDGRVTVFMGIPMLFNKIIQGLLHKVQMLNPIKRAIFRGMLKISSVSNRMGKPVGAKLFRGILRAMGFDHIRVFICGAGALMPEIGEKYRQLGLDFIQGYGLTEAAPVVTVNPVGTPEVRSVGKLLPLIESRLEQSRELPGGAAAVDGHEVGELCIDGPNKMLGYYKNSKATAETFTEDGFLRTGDMGYFDNMGFFYITGRCKNVIVTSGGKNIYPEEIEELFQLYSDIEQVMVRGYKDEGTEKVELVIYPKLSEEWKERISADRNAFLSSDPEKIRQVLDDKLRNRLLANVKEVDHKLLAYQKVSRVRMVLLSLDVTTTQKVKRFLVEERLSQHNDGLLVEAADF